MAWEYIELNICPTGDKPVFHAAQYDVGRPIIIKLKNGEDDFTPTDLDIELQVRKVDNNVVTAVPDSVDGNVVTFLTTEQMTACSGTNLCEVQLTTGDNTMATLHFYLVVQRDALQGGLTSQSEIYNLEGQIAAIVPEVIGDEYYTADEVDEKIAEIPTFDPSNYYDKTQLYTKTETNGLLAQKANLSSLATVATTGDYDDLSNKPTVYQNAAALPISANDSTDTKTYIDTGLSGKADKSELYNILPTEQESGAIAHFTDGADNIPVKSLVSEIVAVQAGSGVPSPDNVREILGFDSGVVTRCGKNLFDGNDIYSVGNNWQVKSGTGFLLKKGVTYTATIFSEIAPTRSYFMNMDGNTLFSANGRTVTYTPTSDVYAWINIYWASGAGKPSTTPDFQLEIGTTATAYEEYNDNNYEFAFGQTVYGGSLDVTTGVLTIDRAIVDMGTLSWTKNTITEGNLFRSGDLSTALTYNSLEAICEIYPTVKASERTDISLSVGSNNNVDIIDNNYSDSATFKTAVTGHNICYPLATPIIVQLTPTEVKTLLGENNIFSNTGDVEVEYHADIGLYIDKKISSLAQT